MMGDWRRLLKRRGDSVLSSEWNDLVRLAAKSFTGLGVIEDTTGWYLRQAKRSGQATAATAQFAKIASKAGSSPPYRYTATEAEMDVDGNWTLVFGGDAYNNVFNIEEQGAGGQWVNPLVVGDVVMIFAALDPSVDAFVCARSHYRGTY